MLRRTSKPTLETQKGFSIIELIIVVLIISILSILAFLSFKAPKKYLADTQAYQIVDILYEARQRALTQHETMRVEIDQTRNIIRLISENEAGNANDDKEIKSLKLESPRDVVVGNPPKNVASYPTELSPTPTLTFKPSVYPSSKSDVVGTLRFTTSGRVLDAGSNAVGDNSTMTGATIYVWMPDYSTSGQPLQTGTIIRAITVQGTSGLASYWKCAVNGTTCDNWSQ